MKYKILLVFLFQSSIFSFAEQVAEISKAKIYGSVLESETFKPIPYATITLLTSKDSTIIFGAIADKNGRFEIGKIPQGSYSLEISFIGYKNQNRKINITKNSRNISLGKIFLATQAHMLDEIEVTKERSTIEQKIDRKVINVGKDLVSAGANALILLTQVPSINVDQDENISMRGNENIKILVDGKPTHIEASQLLKQIPSSSIKTIELITNPSAKYSPEGMSGIINITLKKNTQLGVNGNINLGYTYNKRNKFNNAMNINYRKNKINFFANIGIDFGQRKFHGQTIRRDIELYRNLLFENNGNSNLAKVGFDYFIDKKNSFSFYTNQRIRNNDRNGKVAEDYRLPNNDSLDITQNFKGKYDTYSQTYNVNFRHEFEKKQHFINLEANINKTKREQNAQYKYTGKRDLNDYQDIVDKSHINYIYNVDYTNQLSEKIKLEIGIESRILQTINDYTTTSESFSDIDYTYDTNIHSIYSNLSIKLNKVSIQGGARMEAYKVDAVQNNISIYKDKYLTFYPSVFFIFNPREKNQFQLSYSRRVDRPNLRQISPVRQWSSPSISSFGNPELKPQFTNSFEFNYTRNLKNGSITSGIFYRKIIDEIARTVSIDPDDEYRSILGYNNIGKNEAYGLEISIRHEIAKWWNINTSFDYYSRTLKGVVANENVKINENIANIRLSNNFRATKNLRFQLFGMYRGAHQNLQFQIDPMWKIDIGARYNIWKGKGTISANLSDVFNSFHFAFNATNPYPFQGEFFWGAQRFYVGFSYNFGKKTKTPQRKRQNNQERDDGGGFF